MLRSAFAGNKSGGCSVFMGEGNPVVEKELDAEYTIEDTLRYRVWTRPEGRPVQHFLDMTLVTVGFVLTARTSFDARCRTPLLFTIRTERTPGRTLSIALHGVRLCSVSGGWRLANSVWVTDQFNASTRSLQFIFRPTPDDTQQVMIWVSSPHLIDHMKMRVRIVRLAAVVLNGLQLR